MTSKRLEELVAIIIDSLMAGQPDYETLAAIQHELGYGPEDDGELDELDEEDDESSHE